MNLFRWLSEKTCYTFAIAFLSVLAGQFASFYGYFYFYGYFFVQRETTILELLPSTLWYALIGLLVFVSLTHYISFGLLRAFGFRREVKQLRFINDHISGIETQKDLSPDHLSTLLKALTRFPLWNTVTAGILGSFLITVLLMTIRIYTGNSEYLGPGLRASLVSILIYLYITFVMTDFLTRSMRSHIKQAIYRLGGKFQESYLFSLKGKFASFLVFLLITLAVVTSFSLTSHGNKIDTSIITLFSVFSIAICSVLIILYFTSITRSIEEVRSAAEDLSSGGTGYLFSGTVDKEFVLLNTSIISAAEEVNRYRTKMDNLVREKTKALEKSLEDLNESERRSRSMRIPRASATSLMFSAIATGTPSSSTCTVR